MLKRSTTIGVLEGLGDILFSSGSDGTRPLAGPDAIWADQRLRE